MPRIGALLSHYQPDLLARATGLPRFEFWRGLAPRRFFIQCLLAEVIRATETLPISKADARTIRTVYLRPTDAGLRKIFGDQRVTYTDRDYYRAYGTNQCPDTITNGTILPEARTSVLGKVLITGPKFTDIIGEVSDEILKDTLFCRSQSN